MNYVNQKMFNRVRTKIITILIVGTLMMTAIMAYAGENYNSSRSNTSTSIVNKQVGDILLRYNVGGAEINRVTDALAVGISKADLKATLIEVGIGEEGVNEIFIKLDELGAAVDEEQVAATDVIQPPSEVSVSDTGNIPAKEIAFVEIDEIDEEAISTSSTGKTTIKKKEQAIKKGETKDVYSPPSEVSVSDTEDVAQEIDSFFDVFTELEVFIEIVANDANLTKVDAKKVIDVLMAVSPVFIIDEDGLQESRKAELIEAIASDAGLTKNDARRALDAFVGATTKSAPTLNKLLITGERVALVGSDSFSISKRKARTGRSKYQNIVLKRAVFKDASKNIIRNIRSAAPEERKNLIDELKVSRGTFQTEIVAMSLKIREDAKELRENFRKKMKTVIGHVDHGRTARIAVAHGKGLRMLNRFRSAMARFDHILGRLESRIEKLEARGVDMSSVVPLIEEAKNISVDNETEMEMLKEKYESLLEGENSQGIGREAREIAKELKAKIQSLHAKLREIVNEIKNNITTGEEDLNETP